MPVDTSSLISYISRLWLKMFNASHGVNFTILAGMDISTDFSQPNTFDVIIGRGRTEGREMHGTGGFSMTSGGYISNIF